MSGDSTDRMASRGLFPVAACLFFSGLCSLVYQTTWLREFRLVFGASTPASAAVLAIFMGGIGAGSLWAGRRIDGLMRPFLFYARLELIIGLFAPLTLVLLAGVRTAYIGLGGTAALGPVLGTGLRLVLATLVLVVPTFLMGATLPAAVRAVEHDGDRRRRRAALLYGVNAIGAVTGALVSTFFLFEFLGNRWTVVLAASVNVCTALLAFWISKALGESKKLKAAAEAKEKELGGAVGAPREFVLGAALAAGFAFFLLGWGF